MICVAPAAPLDSVHQCQLSVLIHATCQCPSVPHISAHLSCLSVSPISAMPFSATYQCRLSVPYISAAFQCPSMMPVNAHQCHLPVSPHQYPSVPPISVHQCSLLVPVSAASLADISEGEKSLIYKLL
ncbi:unnamed protein product [Staurois parvus]|uniref:Uncharacterized protein n=1 Tax=Staurois parvus TaxID=386267 RepID=A0ABN9GP60_9NEOB|nr:unnamed protein product [Staurois parvus]